jgi:hypothetical protein
MHKSMRVARGHSLGCQECGDSMRFASKDVGSQEEVIVTSYIAWYGNENVLICIFALFLIQRVLKP